jgi:hypothetical protein
MATRQEFAAVMAYLGTAVGKEPTREQAEVYFDLLGDLPAADLERAAKRALMGHNFPTLPPAGVIRQQATEFMDPPITAGEAWAMVMRAVANGHYERPEPSLKRLPPRVAAAARAYGWRALCDMPLASQQTTFAQFRDVYQSIDTRARTEAALPAGLRSPAVAALMGGIGGMPALTGRTQE